METKSTGIAYLLWFFFGLLGAHKFYIGKIGIGILYLLTGGVFGIGWFIDLFTLGHQVNVANALAAGRAGGAQQNQNVVVNVTNTPAPSQVEVVSAEKQILQLTQDTPILTLKDVITKTSLQMDDAEVALEKMVQKGLVREIVDTDGRKSYDAS